MNRRKFLKMCGGSALAVGAGVAVASPSKARVTGFDEYRKKYIEPAMQVKADKTISLEQITREALRNLHNQVSQLDSNCRAPEEAIIKTPDIYTIEGVRGITGELIEFPL